MIKSDFHSLNFYIWEYFHTYTAPQDDDIVHDDFRQMFSANEVSLLSLFDAKFKK